MLTTILCTYQGGTGSRRDEGAFLLSCLCSFFATRQRDTSIIVVDDGSTDDTVDIVRKLPVDMFIRLPRNQGLRDAFSLAVHNCRTKYFLRVDADIEFTTPGWDELLVSHMEHHPECGVCGATQITRPGKVHSAGDRLRPRYEHIRERVQGAYRTCDSVMGCFSCFRRAAWDAVSGLNCPQWLRSETEDINLRIQKVGAVPGAMGNYEVHCLPFEFRHNHWQAKPKTGRYNDKAQQRRDIAAYMWEHHGVDFYGERGGV